MNWNQLDFVICKRVSVFFFLLISKLSMLLLLFTAHRFVYTGHSLLLLQVQLINASRIHSN